MEEIRKNHETFAIVRLLSIVPHSLLAFGRAAGGFAHGDRCPCAAGADFDAESFADA
jgi:hypothetical protein